MVIMNYKTIDYFIRHLPFGIRKRFYKHFKMKIGVGTSIARGCFIDNPSNVIVGRNCDINYNCEFHSGEYGKELITVGDNVWCACQVKFITITHEVGDTTKRAGKTIFKPITIGDGCWIGANVLILPGVRIGNGCIIAAGSVVNKNCKPNSMYGGVPAKLIKNL